MDFSHLIGHGAMKVFENVKKDPQKALGAAIAFATNPYVVGAAAAVAVVVAVAVYKNKKEDDKNKKK